MRTALEQGDASVLQLLGIAEANQFSVQQTREIVELALADLADAGASRAALVAGSDVYATRRR